MLLIWISEILYHNLEYNNVKLKKETDDFLSIKSIKSLKNIQIYRNNWSQEKVIYVF